MSAPIPYQPPTVQRSVGRADLYLPARKASTLLLVIAVFFAGFGLLAFGMSKAIHTVQLPDDTRAQFHQFELQTHVPFDVFLRQSYRVFLAQGICAGLLGLWVRRGRRLAFRVAIGLVVLEMASMVLSLISVLPSLVSGAGPQALGGVASCLIGFALCGILFGWLLQALRMSRQGAPVTAVVTTVEPIPSAASRGLGYGSFSPPPPLPRRDDA